MLRRIRRLPSPALVISAIALVFAIGGGSFALAISDNAKDKKIAKKVANKQIKKKAPDLSVAHATTADGAPPTGPAGGSLAGTYPNPTLGNSVVSSNNIATDAVTKSKIANASVGSNELGTTQQFVGPNVTVLANNVGSTSVQCPAGTKLLSGGNTTSSFGVHVVEGFQSGNGWLIAVQNTTAANQTFAAIAICLNP